MSGRTLARMVMKAVRVTEWGGPEVLQVLQDVKYLKQTKLVLSDINWWPCRALLVAQQMLFKWDILGAHKMMWYLTKWKKKTKKKKKTAVYVVSCNRTFLLRVVLWSGSTISLICGEKRCVSDMFDIDVFVLLVSGIVCFQSFVASNICELFLWQDKGNLFRRGHTFDGILHWMPQCGGKYGMFWFLSTIMFLYCRQL